MASRLKPSKEIILKIGHGISIGGSVISVMGALFSCFFYFWRGFVLFAVTEGAFVLLLHYIYNVEWKRLALNVGSVACIGGLLICFVGWLIWCLSDDMDVFIIFAATEGLCIFALAHMRKAAHLIALVYSVIFSMRLVLALLSKNTDAILLSTIGVVLCLFSFLYIWTNSEAPRIRYQRARWGKYFQRPIGERAGNVLSLFVLPLVAYWTENLICAYLSSIAVALAYSILVFPRLWASSLRDASDKISCDVFKKIRVMDLPEEIPEKYAATAGFINPVLIVSNHMLRLEKEEMRCILLHEVGHVRGKHYLIQSIYYAIGFSTSILLLLFISELLGWIWLLIFTITSSLLSHKQELLANAFVVREMGEGKTLIKTLRHLYEGKEGRASFINPSLSKMIREIETEAKRMLPETHGNL